MRYHLNQSLLIVHAIPYFDYTSPNDEPILYLYHVKFCLTGIGNTELVANSVFTLAFFYFHFILQLFSWPPALNQN